MVYKELKLAISRTDVTPNKEQEARRQMQN